MTFSEEFIKIFDFLGEKFGIAIDWSNQNIIPYIETLCGKILSWNIATNIFWMVVMTTIFIFGLRFFYMHTKYFDIYCGYDSSDIIKNHIEWDDEALGFVLVVVGIIAIAVPIVVFLTESYELIKTIIFPELKLFEYVESFINK